jgi:hypothetical protein
MGDLANRTALTDFNVSWANNVIDDISNTTAKRKLVRIVLENGIDFKLAVMQLQRNISMQIYNFNK